MTAFMNIGEGWSEDADSELIVKSGDQPGQLVLEIAGEVRVTLDSDGVSMLLSGILGVVAAWAGIDDPIEFVEATRSVNSGAELDELLRERGIPT